MKLLFISDNFPPEVNAPASRTYEHAKIWCERGNDVTVVTSFPNFPKGKIFNGYKNSFFLSENKDGINVIRVKTFMAANEGTILRTLDYLSFLISSVLSCFFIKRPDVVVATSPQFFAAVAGWIISILKLRPFVLEVRDIWPASIEAVGAINNKLVLKILEAIELFLYQRATLIIVVSNSFKKDLINRGVAPNKIEVILNGVDLSFFNKKLVSKSEVIKSYDLENKFIFGYIGTHGLAQNLELIIDTAELLQNWKNIVFLFVGDGARKKLLKQRAQERGLGNIVFVSSQNKNEIRNILFRIDLALVSLKKHDEFQKVIPSKIFEYMAMGSPILACIDVGEARSIILKNNCGVCVGSDDKKVLFKVIDKLLKQPDKLREFRKSGLMNVKKYDRTRLADEMLKQIEKTIS